MKTTVIHSTKNCADSSCPTIYKDEQGNFIIQGFILNHKDKSEISIPEGEDAIVVPADFLMEFVQKQR